MFDEPLEIIRVFLHVLAATIWVGGQFTLAGLVPVLRRAGGDLPKQAAQAFNKIAWPAYWTLIATGIWNYFDEQSGASDAWNTTVAIKVVVVIASGVTAYAHAHATTKRGLAVNGALTALTALGALFLGVLL
jgi:putative copper export protein